MMIKVRVKDLQPGDRFDFIGPSWHGPSVVISNTPSGSGGIRCLKYSNHRIVNPPGLDYRNGDAEVQLLDDEALRRPEAKPLCGREMRDGTCNMEAGHRGRCTTQAWVCEGCGKTRRGTPAAEAPDGPPDDCVYMKFCFMCEGKPFRRYY